MNIIKMDIRRMFKSKVFYLLNIFLVVGILLMGAALSFNLNRNYEDGKNSGIGLSSESVSVLSNDPDITEEEYYLIQDEIKETLDVKEIITFPYNSPVILLILSIFIGFFIGEEMDSGFIKNVIPLSHSRNSLVLSKNIVAFLFILIQSGLDFLTSLLAKMMISGEINFVNSNSLITYLLAQGGLLIAFSSLLILLTYLFKNKTLTVAIGIILSFNALGNLLNIVDSFFDLLSINLSKLTIVGNTVLHEFSSIDFNRIIILVLIYFFVYNLISLITVRKMEIG